MIDAAVQEGPDEATDNSSDSTTDDLSELRGLLLAPERIQLDNLQERLDNPARHAEDVSRVLPSAFKLSLNRDDKLANSLMPTVEAAIGVSVRKDPQRLVDAIFPVMGPAIRKAIAAAFSEMVQSLNKTLEYSVSLKGLKWRLEALRTGKSFAEVVLSHTLLYRVEQVFLIHRETGLLLQHVEAGAPSVEDADLVSGMLTAIQDFVHDSFGAEKSDTLDSMQVGELTVWIERGSQAVLAAVFRGNAPVELRRLMQDELDSIHVEQREALESFAGDAAPFTASRPHLENCMQMQTEAVTRKKPSPVLLAAVALIVLAIGLWMFFSIRESRRWNGYLARLNAEPGLVVVSAEKTGGKYHITGLRDPMAADPAALLAASSIDPAEVVTRWEPYQASHPEFLLARVTRLLEPPRTVSLSVEDGVLVARGAASHDWISAARKVTQMMPSVTGFSDESLVDLDLARSEIAALIQQIERRAIRFAVGSAELTPDQRGELNSVMTEIQRLALLARSQGAMSRVEVWGHADQSGSQEINDRLIAARAEQVVSALLALGINKADIEIADPKASSKLREYTRSASFKAKLIDTPNGNK
ncbi:MAG TPA: OmpA family protein [Blastocatellia bacterium]|nr:OmpA family protein [Blastocatellia bacterium]